MDFASLKWIPRSMNKSTFYLLYHILYYNVFVLYYYYIIVISEIYTRTHCTYMQWDRKQFRTNYTVIIRKVYENIHRFRRAIARQELKIIILWWKLNSISPVCERNTRCFARTNISLWGARANSDVFVNCRINPDTALINYHVTLFNCDCVNYLINWTGKFVRVDVPIGLRATRIKNSAQRQENLRNVDFIQ